MRTYQCVVQVNSRMLVGMTISAQVGQQVASDRILCLTGSNP